MPKMKTRKAVSKRFRSTSKKKAFRRKDGQNHFNAGQAPKKKREKRNDVQITGSNEKNVLRELVQE